jgi:S1-C subfamily serine protease
VTSLAVGYSFLVEPRQRRSPKYIAALAVAAGVILISGWLARPRDIAQAPPPVPSERELQELAARSERRSLDAMTTYFGNLAADVRWSLVSVPSAGMSGVVWDDSHVVTGPMASPDVRTVDVRTASGDRPAEARSSRRLPLSLLEVPLASSERMAHRAASPPATGEWVVAVWQTDGGPAFAAGNVRQGANTACDAAQVEELVTSTPLNSHMIGGGIFNMDRDLLAVVLPCGNRVAAIGPSSVDALVKRAVTIEERLLALYGVLFSTPSPEERRYFAGAGDLLAREVWNGARGEAAGLRAGDVVVASSGQPVATLEDLRALTADPSVPVELQVRRGSKTDTLTLNQTSALEASPDVAQDAGVRFDAAVLPYRIDRVMPGSRAARAGVRAGDRVVRINYAEPRSRASVERAIRDAAAPILLEVARDDRHLAIVIPERVR